MAHCTNVNKTCFFLHLWKYHIVIKLCFPFLIKDAIVSFYKKRVIQKPKPQHVVFYKTIASWLAHHCDSTTRFRTQDARIAIKTLFTKNISLNWLQFFRQRACLHMWLCGCVCGCVGVWVCGCVCLWTTNL